MSDIIFQIDYEFEDVEVELGVSRGTDIGGSKPSKHRPRTNLPRQQAEH